MRPSPQQATTLSHTEREGKDILCFWEVFLTMAQYKGASRDAHRAKTLEKRRERQKEEMELLKNKLAKVSLFVIVGRIDGLATI